MGLGQVGAGDKAGDPPPDPDVELFVRPAEHFGSAVIPQQGARWCEELPGSHSTKDESKEVLVARDLEEEREVLRRLLAAGSSSEDILAYLNLTRSFVAEAVALLRGGRRLQVNLPRALPATRFKVLTGGKVYRTSCPKARSFSKDSFPQTLACYGINWEVL